MKKRNLIRALAALLCLCALALCSCGEKYYFALDEEGNFVDEKSGVTYNIAPLCYEAISVSSEIFATQGKVDFFAITGTDTSRWLSDSFGIVYYAKGTKLPTLKEMNVSHVDIFENDELVDKVSDPEKINELKALYENGKESAYPGAAGLTPNVNLRLKFADADHGIYYVLAYLEYPQEYVYKNENGKTVNCGKKFIYNRGEICLAVDGLPTGVYGSVGTSGTDSSNG